MTRRTSIACLMAISISGGLAWADDDETSLVPQGKGKGANGGGIAFKKIDTNHDGQISKAEFETVAEKMAARRGRSPGGRAERLFDRLDTDHSGSLSQGEFQKLQALRGQMRARLGRRNGNS
jgi:hypothetical protein